MAGGSQARVQFRVLKLKTRQLDIRFASVNRQRDQERQGQQGFHRELHAVIVPDVEPPIQRIKKARRTSPPGFV